MKYFYKIITRDKEFAAGSVSDLGRSFEVWGEALSWNISSFIKVLEDGIMNSVWHLIYFVLRAVG
jgi:hypothetical protein